MKTLENKTVAADPVISEVRRAKTAVAEKYGFDVIAMVRALRQIDEEENGNKTEAAPREIREAIHPLPPTPPPA